MKTKRVFATYQLNQIQAMSECFTKMAAKGWFLKEINNVYYLFEKGEPSNTRRYTVDVFEKASAYSVAPSEEQQEYTEYCKSAGWDYVDSNGRFIVFSTDDQEAVEIQSDMSIKLKRIHKGMMRNCVWPGLLIIVLYSLLFYGNIKMDSASSYSYILMSLAVFFLYLIVEYMIWYLRSRRYLKAYNTFAPDNHLRVTIVQWTYVVLLLAVLVREVLSIGTGNERYMILAIALVEILALWGTFVLCKKIGAALKTPGWVNAIIMFVLVFVVMMAVSAVMMAGIIGSTLHDQHSNHNYTRYKYTAEDGEHVTGDLYQDALPVDMEFLGIPLADDLVMSCYAESEPSQIDGMTVWDFWEYEIEDDYREKEKYPRLNYTLFTSYDDMENVADYCFGTSEDRVLQTKETLYGESMLYRNDEGCHEYLITNGERALYVSITKDMELSQEQLEILIDCVLDNTQYVSK